LHLTIDIQETFTAKNFPVYFYLCVQS